MNEDGKFFLGLVVCLVLFLTAALVIEYLSERQEEETKRARIQLKRDSIRARTPSADSTQF